MDYHRTTGKDFSKENNLVKCSSCGFIYDKTKKICPECNSSDSEFFQRTVSSLDQERKENG